MLEIISMGARVRPRVAYPALVALLLPVMSACGLHDKPKVERRDAHQTPAVAIAATESSRQKADSGAPAPVVAPGVVEPWDAQVALSAQEPGWIDTILVREGDVVRAGQIVAVLSDAAQRHAVDAARADLMEAEAVQAKQVRGTREEELRQAEAEQAAAAARATFAKANAIRVGRLRASGGAATNDIERIETEAAVQAAMAEQSGARLQALRRGARREDREAVAARVSGARARVALAIAALERRRVHAPRAGTVLLSRFHAGEFYDPQQGALVALGDLSRLQVRLEVDEIDAHDLRVGARTSVVSDAGEPLASGTVVRLAPSMGRRALSQESPTARADVRVREVFVEVPSSSTLVPGQRVWGHTPRTQRTIVASAAPRTARDGARP